ncbi:uncharacterized protein RCO7_05614 [Rhynchosporium graminicola]|uniref:Uncharacterized protein n=1 Tax=Rhynchosporium graminicola TaxID=2792576 RepID=A0A1E1L316_9HELO|nr:uncharacterized protein RCO7_05614 [Rhynchosporium commune]
MSRNFRFFRRSTSGEISNSSSSISDKNRQVEVSTRSRFETILQGLVPSQQVQTQSTASLSDGADAPSDEPPLYDAFSPPSPQDGTLLVDCPETFRSWFLTSDERRDYNNRLVAGDREFDLPGMSIEEAQAMADHLGEKMIRRRYPVQVAVDQRPSPAQPPAAVPATVERSPSISQEDSAAWRETDTYRNLVYEYALDGQTREQAKVSANLYFTRLRSLTADRNRLRAKPRPNRPEPGSALHEHYERLRVTMLGWGMSPLQVEGNLDALYLEEEHREGRAMMWEG